MTRVIGRGLIGLGFLLSLVWMLLPLYGGSDGPSLWQATSRIDILMFLFVAGGLGLLAAAAFTSGLAETFDALASIIAGGAAAIVTFIAVEDQWDKPLRVVFGVIIALALTAGGVLLALPAVASERLAEAISSAGSRAAAQAQASSPRPAAAAATAGPAPGWYADPAGQHTTRFWDGRAWTERVR